MLFIGYYNLANFVTLAGLISSVLACFFAIGGDYKTALGLFLAAGVCDMFDGRIARKLKKNHTERTFGVQIDTVCDMVSFGVTPVIISYALGFRDLADILIYLLFVVCGAIRLAYFNTQALTEAEDLNMKVFTGFPIPSICFVLPFLYLLMIFVDPSIMHFVFKAAYFVVGIAFILRIHIPKPKLVVSAVLAVLMLAVFLAVVFCGELRIL